MCTYGICDPKTGDCVGIPVSCPEGSSCNPENGICEDDDAGSDPECAGQTCGNFTTCNEGGSCGTSGICGSTAEGGGLCVNGATLCAGLTTCPNGSTDCGAGEICFVDSCCGDAVCMPGEAFCSDPPENGPTSIEVLLLESVTSKKTFANPGEPNKVGVSSRAK